MFGETTIGGRARTSNSINESANSVQAQRTSCVAREIETGKKLGAALHDLVDRLASRVEPVLVAQPPSNAVVEPTGTMPSASTDLAREIQALNGTFAEVGRRLTILLDSIDL